MFPKIAVSKLGHAVNTMVSWGHQGHDEQRAAAIIGALLGYASLKNALGFPLNFPVEKLNKSILNTVKTKLMFVSEENVEFIAPGFVNSKGEDYRVVWRS